MFFLLFSEAEARKIKIHYFKFCFKFWSHKI